MAGIGFNLTRALQKNSFQGLFHAYGLTTLLGSGPGLLTLLTLGIICFFSIFGIPTAHTSHGFLTLIIYLFSSSMLLSSFLQYWIVRYIADMEFIKEYTKITPNVIGILFLQIILSTSVASPLILYFFANYDASFKILLIAIFNILCLTWTTTAVLSEIKAYYYIIWGFIVGYGVLLDIHFFFPPKHYTINFLLTEFLIAQSILLSSLLYAVIIVFPSSQNISFDFCKRNNLFYSLMLANFFYCLGFWVDKYLFWFNNLTGITSFYPLKSSPVYDLPMFVSMLTMIPGISIFMLRLESEFAMLYPTVMEAVFQQKTLAEINMRCNQLVLSGQEAVYSLIKGQTAFIIIVFLLALYLFKTLHLATIHLPLLFILIISAGLQVMLWALLSILYYMTKYKHALITSIWFFCSNFIFTYISLQAGPQYYGYGLAFSLLTSIICALYLLNKDFKDITYNTFMMVD